MKEKHTGFTLILENDNNIISTDDITTLQNMNIMSEEQHSSVSSNGSDTPDNLDNGYEHPYTTLVSNSADEDTHVYLTSKQTPINENTYPSSNDSCEQYVEFIEKDSTSDNARTHRCKESVILNYGVTDLIETDNDAHRSPVSLRTHESAYTNLSVNQ